MNYAALAAWIAQQPAGQTDAQLAAAVVAPIAVNRPVPRGQMHEAFDQLLDTSGAPAWEAIEAHKSDASPLGIACRAALRLRDAQADYPAIDVTRPVFAASLAGLVQGGLITSDQEAAILALGSAQTTPAEQAGCGELLAWDAPSVEHHIGVARETV